MLTRNVLIPKCSARAALNLALVAALPLFSQSLVPTSSIDFGMLGLARGQTMRLSVVAVAPSPCVAQIGFQSATGANFPGNPSAPINPSFPGNPGFPTNPGAPVVLGPSQGAFVDLIGNQVVAQVGQRVEVHPVIAVQPSPTGVAASVCRGLVEILDSVTGFSLLLLPGKASPSGPLDFGLQGVASGQVARLNIVAVGGPCQAVLGFRDWNGFPAGPSDKTVNLTTGQADFLDIVGSSLVASFGQRAEVLSTVTSVPGAAGIPASCRATSEVWDVFTGRTWAAVPSGPND